MNCSECGRFMRRRGNLCVCSCGAWSLRIVTGDEQTLAAVLSAHFAAKEAEET